MATDGIKTLINPPESFSFDPEVWETWKSRFKRYINVSGQSGKSDREKIDLLIYLMGAEAENIYGQLPERPNNFDSAIKAFDDYFHPKMKLISLRTLFNKRTQEEGEVIGKFISDVQAIADKCQFGSKRDDLVRDRILAGMRDFQLCNQLKSRDGLTLDEIIVMIQQAGMNHHDDLDKVNSDEKSNPSVSRQNNCPGMSFVYEDKSDLTIRKRLCTDTSSENKNMKIIKEDKEVQTLISLASHNCCANVFTSSTTINDLNDDCLLNIFSYLSLPNRIKIERVCKRWKRISLESWKNVKLINISIDFKTSSIELNQLEEILRRSGDFVTNLDCRHVFDTFFTKFESLNYETINLSAIDSIQLINKYCKKLTDLDITYAFNEKDNNYLNALNESLLGNLKSFKIGHNVFDDQDLPFALENAKNLENFSLEGYHYRLHENKLLNLSGKCKTLSIIGSKVFSSMIFQKLLQKCPNIQNLDIHSADYILPGDLHPIMNQLKALGLGSKDRIFNILDNGCFENLKCPYLRILNLSHSFISTNRFLILIENCPVVEDLRLIGNFFENEIFEHLKKWKNLKHLDVNWNYNVSNDSLISICASKKLEKLCCHLCRNITATGLSEIISSSPKLNYLAFSSKKLTKTLVESALSSLCKRKNQVGLTISLRSDFVYKVPHQVNNLKLKNETYQYSKTNFLRIVYGLNFCLCNFEQTCHCLDSEETLVYFG